MKLSFDCWPQRFLTSGSESVTLYDAGTIYNPTSFIAQPMLTMYGANEDAILRVGTTGTVTDPTLNFAALGSNLDNTIVDCREQEVYRDGVNLNQYVSGTIPVLRPGTNYISWAGGISAVRIQPRWWRL